MADPRDEFDDLLRRVRDGSDQAMRELVENYGPHLMYAIRRKLNPRLRSLFDSTDFAQSVWASFYAGRKNWKFDHPDALVALLHRLARGKLTDAVRQHLLGKHHNLNAERSLDGSALPAGEQLRASALTASQVAIAKEEWQRLVDDVQGTEQRVLDLSMAGRSAEEIATELGLTYRHVNRVLHNLAARLVGS